MSPKTRTISSRAVLLAALCAAVGGCAGHGNYTKAHKEQAELRVAQMKSATEWDMAHQQFMAGDLKKALASVDRSITLNGQVAKSHVLRGRILIETGALEMALPAFERALEIDPTNTDAHYYKGIVFERFGEGERALACYTRAAELDPTNAQYPLAAAEALIDLERLDEARKLLEGGTRRFEHNAGIRQTLGHIAMMQHRYDDACRTFEDACRLAPDDPALREDLARAQIAAKRFAQAESTLGVVLAQDPQGRRRDLVRLRARCLMELDRPVEARDILLSLTSDPRGANDPELWTDLGTVSVVLSDRVHLRRAAQRLISIAPRSAEGHVLMAMLHRLNGDPHAALAAVRRAKEFPSASSLTLEGVLCKQLGRHEEAAKAFAMASAHQTAGEKDRITPQRAGAGGAIAEVHDDN